MPLGAHLLYQAGYVPVGDVRAQERCFGVVNKALAKINARLASGDLDAKPEMQQLQSVHSLLKDLAGSYSWRKAKNFWQYWDKNKKQIISIAIPDGEFLTEVGVLEDGRYYD